MNHKMAIKGVLFSIAALSASPVFAGAEGELRLVEDLPAEQRVIVHQHVLNYLNQHPETAADVNVIAVDAKGTVYVLDHKMVARIICGAPSCITDY